ncbi:hypothetical protein [Nocardia albiluteola]|uniref:hypothetical protein n=1 Tax=Nocardia TaxID=1817 RepID=UPI0027E03C43|nr:hypothetical protein [Nocardia albiluteola]
MLPAAADRAGLSSGPAAMAPVPGSDAQDFGLDAGESVPIRPLSFRELLDLPFAVIQADIKKLAALGLAGLVLAEDIVVAITVAGSAATQGSDAGTAWSAILSTAVTGWLLRLFLRGVTVPIGLAGVRGRPMTWRGALRQLGRRLGPLLGDRLFYTLQGIAVPAMGLLVVFAGILGAIPLLGWLRARRLCLVPALFEEQATYRGAVGRAKILAAGAEWRLAGLWLAQRVLFLVMAVPLLGVPLFISDFSGTHRWAVIVLATSGVLLIAAFTEVVDAATSVVGYVDRRCRREAMDVRIPDPAKRIPGTIR